MLTLHSSELMPDGSPVFKTEKDIEILYDHLNHIFTFAKKYFQSGTLTDYYNSFIKQAIK